MTQVTIAETGETAYFLSDRIDGYAVSDPNGPDAGKVRLYLAGRNPFTINEPPEVIMAAIVRASG
jgi:hypothetical protein